MEELKTATEAEFDHVCRVAKQEVNQRMCPSRVYCVTSKFVDCVDAGHVFCFVLCFFFFKSFFFSFFPD